MKLLYIILQILASINTPAEVAIYTAARAEELRKA